MHNFIRHLITEWRRLKLPTSAATVIVAVSGGADSVSLLLAVHELVRSGKLNLRIVAAHFNHRLRGAESDADQEFVRQLTGKHGIELALGHRTKPFEGNLEQDARDHRYAFLAETASDLNACAVLTGHTVNDQAETFLLNLIRGAGPGGLAGMAAVRPLGRSENDVDDAVSLVFCHDKEVQPRYDTMNEDTAFKRVRIRKVLLPMLKEMNPKIVTTLASTASLMGQIPSKAIESERAPVKRYLEIKSLRQLSEPELFAVIRGWLREMRGTTRQLQLIHIAAIGRLAFSDKSGKIAELPGGRVIRSGGKLTFEKNKVEN